MLFKQVEDVDSHASATLALKELASQPLAFNQFLRKPSANITPEPKKPEQLF